jgi:hypothetical protein
MKNMSSPSLSLKYVELSKMIVPREEAWARWKPGLVTAEENWPYVLDREQMELAVR